MAIIQTQYLRKSFIKDIIPTLVEIPDDILASIRIPRKELEKELKTDLALTLYQREAISFGNARKLNRDE